MKLSIVFYSLRLYCLYTFESIVLCLQKVVTEKRVLLYSRESKNPSQASQPFMVQARKGPGGGGGSISRVLGGWFLKSKVPGHAPFGPRGEGRHTHGGTVAGRPDDEMYRIFIRVWR